METLGDRSRDRKAEMSHPPDPDGSWAGRWAEESRAYIVRVCGPQVDLRVLDRALDEVARVAGDGAAPPAPEAVEGVRAAVRQAALAEAERRAARVGARLRRLVHLNAGCAKVPGLLRERAAGRLSAAEVLDLYRRLDRCQECAELTGRLDAAEWHLHQALAGPARTTNGAGRPASPNGSQAIGDAAIHRPAPAAEPAGPDARPPTRPAPAAGTANPDARSSAKLPEAGETAVAPASEPVAARPARASKATSGARRTVSTAAAPPAARQGPAKSAGVGRRAGTRALPTFSDPRPPQRTGLRTGRRRGTFAGAAVLLVLAVGLIAATQLRGSGHHRSAAGPIPPISRQPLAPVSTPAPNPTALPGSPGSELLLGAAPAPLTGPPVPAAPRSLTQADGGSFAATVVGSPAN